MNQNQHSKDHETLDHAHVHASDASGVVTQDDIDLLISRAVDGSASQAEWVLLQGQAVRQPGVWKDLALTFRHTHALTRRVGLAGEAAARTQLPEAGAVLRHDGHEASGRAHVRHHWNLGRIATFGGWAAAAVLALAMVKPMIVGTGSTGNSGSGNPNTMGGGLQAGIFPASYLDGLAASIQKGKEEGRVVGELPENEVIETVPNPDGTYTVTSVRKIVERATIPHFYRAAQSDTGELAAVRFRPVVVSGQASQRRPQAY
jgi:hypothetical protein